MRFLSETLITLATLVGFIIVGCIIARCMGRL